MSEMSDEIKNKINAVLQDEEYVCPDCGRQTTWEDVQWGNHSNEGHRIDTRYSHTVTIICETCNQSVIMMYGSGWVDGIEGVLVSLRNGMDGWSFVG